MNATSNNNEQQVLLSSTHFAETKLDRLQRRKQGMFRRAKSCENLFEAIPAIAEAERQRSKRSRSRVRRSNTTPTIDDRWKSQSCGSKVAADVAPCNLMRRASSSADETETLQSQHASACSSSEATSPDEPRPVMSRWDSDKSMSGHKDTSPTLLLRRTVNLDDAKHALKRTRSLQPPELPCRDHASLSPPMRISSFQSVV